MIYAGQIIIFPLVNFSLFNWENGKLGYGGGGRQIYIPETQTSPAQPIYTMFIKELWINRESKLVAIIDTLFL